MLSYSELDKSEYCHAAWAGGDVGKWGEGYKKVLKVLPQKKS